MNHMFDDESREARFFSFDPDPHGAHVKILKLVGRDKKVLDVGCAHGHLSKKFKENGCFVIGIEIDPIAAEEARKICDDVIVGDIEELDLPTPYSRGYFDVIVFGDILEHLKRPDTVLKKAKNWLKPDGYVVANVPNAVRIEYRLKILLGKFEYGRGLGQHPPTHLRFFTLKSVKQLFQESGYKIQRIESTGLGDKLKILHGLFSWSFIVVAKPINQRRLLSPP